MELVVGLHTWDTLVVATAIGSSQGGYNFRAVTGVRLMGCTSRCGRAVREIQSVHAWWSEYAD